MDITIFTDSQLLFGHLTKGWKVNKNKDLFESSSDLFGEIGASHNIQLKHLPREQNKAGLAIEAR
jgi:ribonuclease HI